MSATARVDLGLDTSGRPILMTRRMQAAFDRACENAGVVPTIVQGAFMTEVGGGAAASAGYHDLSGCIDTRVWNLTIAEQQAILREARRIGWAVWLRDHRHGMDPHMHWVLLDEPNCAAGAVWQMAEYRAGRDGLASRGPDYHWRPDPIPTFDYLEDDMPTTDEIVTALMDRNLTAKEGELTVAKALRQASRADDAVRALNGLPEKVAAAIDLDLPAGDTITRADVRRAAKTGAERALRDVLGELDEETP